MKKPSQIRMGAIMSYVAIIFNMIAGLIYTPWMIEKIGQSNYGLYTLATSFITMFTIDFGMSAAATRFLSMYNAEGKQEQVNNLVGIIYKLYLGIDLIILSVITVLYFYLGTIYSNLSTQELETFKILYLIVGGYTVISFPFTNLNGMLSAYEQFAPLKLCDIFHKILVIILMIVSLLLGQGVYALVLVNSLAGMVLIVIKLVLIKRKTPIKANFTYKDKGILTQFFGFSAWTTVASLAQRLIFNITPSIIAAVSVSGTIGVAIFGLATTIEGYVFTFATAINGMFMPRISRIVNEKNSKEELLSLMVKVGRLQCVIIGILVVGFVALGEAFIVDIWRKPDFSASYICAVLLILPSFLYLPMQIAHTTMIVENKVKLRAMVYIAVGVINVGLSLVLSHFFGAVGATISIFISYMVRAIIMAIIYQKVLGFDMPKFFKETYLNLVPQLIFALAIGLACSRFNPIQNVYLNFITNGCAMVGSYFLVMWIHGFNPYEKGLISSVLGVLRRK